MPESNDEDAPLPEVVSLLDDEHNRTILTATSETALSASELGERCGVSTSSIYRRVERLQAVDLLAEHTRPRRDGHHETVYRSRLARFELTIRDGDLTWDLERADADVTDHLARLWGRF